MTGSADTRLGVNRGPVTGGFSATYRGDDGEFGRAYISQPLYDVELTPVTIRY